MVVNAVDAPSFLGIWIVKVDEVGVVLTSNVAVKSAAVNAEVPGILVTFENTIKSPTFKPVLEGHVTVTMSELFVVVKQLVKLCCLEVSNGWIS